jgi:peptidoglycan/xylan/chitin deacetylase (PgdA/CDA1 family)
MRNLLVVRAALLLAMISFGAGRAVAAEVDPNAVGQTRVARWQDDKAGCFLLMFDDSWPSAWQVAVPELVKRGMTGTFYICPGKGEYKKFADKWEKEVWRAGMVYGDHTMTHQGVKDLADAEREIGGCAKEIRRIVPGAEGRLVSYAQPGVPEGKWNITDKQLDELLAEHHLITRGDIRGKMAVYHLKTAAEILGLADKAIAAKGVDFVVIHGVERIKPDWGYQDMWALKQTIFTAVLDGLKERQDQGKLWITDHISSHQYATERDAAAVKVSEAGADKIRVELTCSADPKWYDLPLTLVTRVPAGWGRVRVVQGKSSDVVDAKDGAARYRATPGGGPVTLTADGK